ncbi:glycosyltransferase family 2 protein [Salegentibacter sp. UBA1130]|uniref:glycosyltransferase family 2 protein n=1 Tax=Salegentibacter sp. UBA1130 TaxID=1947451 RepID=UPI00257D3905|nr:glycosyltransferase family 2 protein [Salegentibacter sp. UBA1130]
MISIVIATYNSGKTILRTIESVLKQTNECWELVIIDDGSIDNTEKIIREIKDARIKYYYQANNGVSSARNFGVNKTFGEYILFLDADDELIDSAIDSFTKELQSKNIGILSGAYIDIFERTNYPRDKGYFFNNHLINNLSGAYILKKEVFESVGGYDINLSQSENWELFIRVIRECEKRDLKIESKKFLTFRYNSDHSTEKNLKRNINAYNSYSYLTKKYEKEPMLRFFCAQIAASNAYRIGSKNHALKWQFVAIKVKPFNVKAYLRFFKFLIGYLIF